MMPRSSPPPLPRWRWFLPALAVGACGTLAATLAAPLALAVRGELTASLGVAAVVAAVLGLWTVMTVARAMRAPAAATRLAVDRVRRWRVLVVAAPLVIAGVMVVQEVTGGRGLVWLPTLVIASTPALLLGAGRG
jgi:hypothetical protein